MLLLILIGKIGVVYPMIKNRIKEYRARFDMKQEELAAKVGVRRETIGNLEKGKYNPSLVWHGISQRHSMLRLKKFLQ